MTQALNDVIYETVVTTRCTDGRVHAAPMGVRYRGAQVVLMPFRPSTTLDNLLRERVAVLNIVTDTRVFAGCVTGRQAWPTCPVADGLGERLAVAMRHLVLRLAAVSDDAQRPVLTLDIAEDRTHAPFPGLNRAQAAVIEGAVLVSRRHLLPRERIDREMAQLQTAIDKTASAVEHEAWGWLQQAMNELKTPMAGEQT
ncbi:DUF447 domain-containing protein [uncultured Sphaerotilus sp.]|uniref:DUF447 domain-containing protein n=1 Tax=uncultured Sphaerotilus sp. TaxID=474984 RepID=UPI0030CA2E36